MKREEINRAILEVIREKDGRRNRKARELVMEAGYIPYERYGYFSVKNAGTNKEVHFSTFKNPNKVDFVNYLETPVNKDYNAVQAIKENPIGKAEDRIWKLMCLRQRVEWNEEYIEKNKKEIEYCLDRIKDLQRYIVKYELENEKAKQEIKDYMDKIRKEREQA